MKRATPSPDSISVARIAFGRLDASVGTLTRLSCEAMGLRKASDYPFGPTKLLLQAAHQRNTRT